MARVSLSKTYLCTIASTTTTLMKTVLPPSPAGMNGDIGPQGIAGERGNDGATGLPGAEGAAGPTGERGQRGEQGGSGEGGTAMGLVSWNQCSWANLNAGQDYGLIVVRGQTEMHARITPKDVGILDSSMQLSSMSLVHRHAHI